MIKNGKFMRIYLYNTKCNEKVENAIYFKTSNLKAMSSE